MKHFLIYFTPFVLILTISYPSNLIGNSGGSPGGKTGSPSDNMQTCQGCHYSGNGNGATITTNIPPEGYTAGNIYTITASIAQNGINKFGFEITSEENNFGSAKVGTFLITDPVSTQIVNNGTAVSHKFGGTSGVNTKSWTFDWEAPSSANSGITFYGAFLAANSNGNNSGDTYHSANIFVEEASTSNTNNIDYSKVFSINNNRVIFNKNLKHVFVYDLSGKIVVSKIDVKKGSFVDVNKNLMRVIKAIDEQGIIYSKKYSSVLN